MRRFILSLAFCLGLAPAALADQLLVIGSTDPKIPPGTVLDADAPLTVPEGSELRLLFEDGSPLAVKGPFSGTPPRPAPLPEDTGEGPLLVEALAEMVGEGRVDSSEFGAARSALRKSVAGDPWSVDLSFPGVVCIQSGGRPVIWRKEAGEGVFRALDGGEEAGLTFAGDGKPVPWPAALPVASDAGYAFVTAGGSPILMTVKRVPAALPTLAHVIRWLKENECGRQARLLLGVLANAEPEDPLTIALGTPRGEAPRYKVGETLTIDLWVSQNAHVRCFYAQADGSTVQLFPNRFNPSQRLAGPFIHTIPHAKDRFSITLGGPPGHETVRCFGWREDPAAGLPADVKEADVTKPLERPFTKVAADIMASKSPPVADSTLSIEVTE